MGVLHVDGHRRVTALPGFLVSKDGVQHGVGELLGYRADETSVSCVKHLQAGAVLGGVTKTCTEQLHSLLAFRQLSHQLHLALTPQLGRGEGIREDDRLQPLGLDADFELGGEHTSPRVTNDVIVGDLEMLEDVEEFVHEEINGEEISRFVLEMTGATISDLIVEEDRSGLMIWERQVRNGEHVIVSHARAWTRENNAGKLRPH